MVHRLPSGPLFALALLSLAGCDKTPPGPSVPIQEPRLIPLTELTDGSYYNYEGGLYPGSTNLMPATHDSVGLARARAVVPVDAGGSPSPGGKYVLLSVGMSNTTQEFCSQSSDPPCNAWTFMGQAAADTAVNHTTLVMVNGARAGEEAQRWEAPQQPNYDRIRDHRLIPLGLTEQQVLMVWLKVADANPRSSLPTPGSDAELLASRIANIARALRTRYPNVKQVFVSSRIYAGYATTALNPEPYAYESGFSVKGIIATQISQMSVTNPPISPTAGNLNYNTVAPWLAWGPYLWADSTNARGDGLTWEPGDFEADGTHPSRSGETKVGKMLLEFFKASPYTKCWFLKSAPPCE